MRTFSKRVIMNAFLSTLCATLFAGCGGGGASLGSSSGSALPQSARVKPQSVIAEAAKGNVSFAIGFTPKAKAAVGGRREILPQYVSASTASLKILTDGGTPVIVDLSPSSPNCSPNPSVPGSYICTASLSVPAGDHVFTVTAYDLPDAKGNVLSTNSTGTVYVKPTGTTTVPLVLDGFVQYVVLTLATTSPPVNSPATIDLTAILQDADHNLIVGPAPYEYPVTLTTSDSTDGPVSKTTLNSPADTSGLTVKYDGASVASITYSAKATDLPSANVTNAVLKPSAVTVAATSTGALTTLVVGGTVYAFVPTSSMSLPNSSGLLVQVPLINGGGIITSSATHTSLEMVAVKPQTFDAKEDLSLVAGAHPAMTRLHPDFVNPTLSGTGGVTACSGDQVHLRLYCVDNATSSITVLDASVVPARVTKTIATDALRTIGFSGGGCIICGVVYDPTDDAAIVGTANGIEVYSATGAHISTTLANTSETFGYNPVTNQVFNPEYSGTVGLPSPSLDVVDIKSKTRYTLTGDALSSAFYGPDQGAVDSTTNLGVSFEEYINKGYFLVPIGSGKYSAPTNSFTEAKPVQFPFSSGIFFTCNFGADGIAVDSRIDVAFFNGEYCVPGTIGAAQLPTAPTASPTVSSFAFAPVPDTPDGQQFVSGYDPHAQATVFGTFGDYGIIFNGQLTYLAVTDLKKLLAAPRDSTDATVIDPAYDLIANKVVTFVPI